MASTEPLLFKGVPGSPYTRKMLAYLRYRHIRYQLLIGDQASHMNLPEAKVHLLPTFYLHNDQDQLEAAVDSTPLIRRFEAEFPGRKALPSNPVLGFINDLLEDYGDEWLTKAMFHYRWYYADDIATAGKILPRWSNNGQSEEKLAELGDYISQRQISRLYVVGSNDTTAPVIEASYLRFLGIFDQLLQRHPFVLGDRPSSADFAIYAQLTQLAKFDPTPMKLCLQQAPRVHAWTDIVDDLSGQPATDEGWIEPAEIREHLGELLSEVGKVYIPALLANNAAIEAGQEDMNTTIDGQPWTQPTFPYQAKCLQALRQSYFSLDPADREGVDAVLQGTGCEAFLENG
jgi:glutathione S-transferase